MSWSRFLHPLSASDPASAFELVAEFQLRRSVLRLAGNQHWPRVELRETVTTSVISPDERGVGAVCSLGEPGDAGPGAIDAVAGASGRLTA